MRVVRHGPSSTTPSSVGNIGSPQELHNQIIAPLWTALMLGVRIYRSVLPDAAVLAPSPERLTSLGHTRAPTTDPAPATR